MLPPSLIEYCSNTANGNTPEYVIALKDFVWRVDYQTILTFFKSAYLISFAFSGTSADFWFTLLTTDSSSNLRSCFYMSTNGYFDQFYHVCNVVMAFVVLYQISDMVYIC